MRPSEFIALLIISKIKGKESPVITKEDARERKQGLFHRDLVVHRQASLYNLVRDRQKESLNRLIFIPRIKQFIKSHSDINQKQCPSTQLPTLF